MILARTRPDLESAIRELRQKPGPLALVPTMGSLHEGHLSLVDAAKAENGVVFVAARARVHRSHHVCLNTRSSFHPAVSARDDGQPPTPA